MKIGPFGGGKERGGQPSGLTRQAGSQEAKTPEQVEAERMRNAAVSYAGMLEDGEALMTKIGQQYHDPVKQRNVFDQAMDIRAAKEAAKAGGNGTQG